MKKTLFLFMLVFSVCTKAQIITTIAGNGTDGYTGDGGQATSAEVESQGLALDKYGNIYLTEIDFAVVRKITVSTGTITTVAGNGTVGYSGDGGQATLAQLNTPFDVTVDAQDNLYIVDEGANCIRKINSAGIITTFAGTGTAGFSGDGGPATSAQISQPEWIDKDSFGNIYFIDYVNDRVRKISTNGIIETVAGGGSLNYINDSVPALSSSLAYPDGIVIDAAGVIYISENNFVRKISLSGIITKIVGDYSTQGYSGDGGPANLAVLSQAEGLTIDKYGNLYICDISNNVIRKVDTNGIINTIAGNGFGAGSFSTGGYSGDGGLATAAEMYSPFDVKADTLGNIYIVDGHNNVIRKVTNAYQTSVKNFNISNNISVCPNPTTGILNITGLTQNSRVQITDVVGNELIQTNIQQGKTTIDVSNLQSGVYFIKTPQGTQKFIKQ